MITALLKVNTMMVSQCVRDRKKRIGHDEGKGVDILDDMRKHGDTQVLHANDERRGIDSCRSHSARMLVYLKE